jgi:RloB-like protein
MPKRKNSYSDRNINSRAVKERFLIVCGSAETEVNYFNRFRVPKKVVPAPGDPCRLVKKTYQFAAKDEYDQIWCVFDRDPHTALSSIMKYSSSS